MAKPVFGEMKGFPSVFLQNPDSSFSLLFLTLSLTRGEYNLTMQQTKARVMVLLVLIPGLSSTLVSDAFGVHIHHTDEFSFFRFDYGHRDPWS